VSGLRERGAGRASQGARGPRTRAEEASAMSVDRREPVPQLREPRYSQSLERGLAILECFTPERPVRGIADLADELGMSRSTTHRYALTLTELGFLVRSTRRRYRLGLRVTELGLSTLSSTSLRIHAQPALEELSMRVPYPLAIAVLDGPEVLYVDCVLGSRRARHAAGAAPRAGDRVPAHRTAIGKLLVANLPEPVCREVTTELPLERAGPRTITSKTALRAEFARIREEGLATADEEAGEGLYEIAAPVRSQAEELLAAVSMTAHRSTISLDQLVEHLGPHLISTADRISAQVGYRREDERGGM
jgi:IclR family transcriptional regulator, pca regulon regulatory protein